MSIICKLSLKVKNDSWSSFEVELDSAFEYREMLGNSQKQIIF